MPIFCHKDVNSLKNFALMPIFCQKNISSPKNTALPCLFFQIFHKKPYAVMPKSDQKNVNSVITILSYWPKKSIGCPFFQILNEKTSLLMPILCQKNVHSLKNTMLSCPYFIKKTSILSKSQFSHVIFFNFFMKNPQSCHAHIW